MGAGAEALFAVTAAYDAAIATELEKRASGAEAPDSSVGADGRAEARPLQNALPTTLRVIAKQETPLRYGENPHQKAALYTDGVATGDCECGEAAGQGA